MKEKLIQSMSEPDEFVISMVYEAKDGSRTKRTVSPIKMFNSHSFVALCLCRQEPRIFQISGCSEVELVGSSDVLMPIEIQNLN